MAALPAGSCFSCADLPQQGVENAVGAGSLGKAHKREHMEGLRGDRGSESCLSLKTETAPMRRRQRCRTVWHAAILQRGVNSVDDGQERGLRSSERGGEREREKERERTW